MIMIFLFFAHFQFSNFFIVKNCFLLQVVCDRVRFLTYLQNLMTAWVLLAD